MKDLGHVKKNHGTARKIGLVMLFTENISIEQGRLREKVVG